MKKASRLAEKRAQQAAHKQKRQAECKKEVDLVDAQKELDKRQKELNQAYKEHHDMIYHSSPDDSSTLVYRVPRGSDKGHFVGPGSTAANEKLQALRDKIQRLKLRVQQQQIVLDPDYLNKVHQKKVADAKRNADNKAFWDNAIAADKLSIEIGMRTSQIVEYSKQKREAHLEHVRQQAAAETMCCYIMRKSGGSLTVKSQTGYVHAVKCYHFDSEGYLSMACDCTREEKEGESLSFTLTAENQKLVEQGLLLVDDSQWEVQQLRAKQLFNEFQVSESAKSDPFLSKIAGKQPHSGTGSQVFGFLGPFVH